jgi:MFS family permease
VRTATFSSLRVRNFRLYFFGQIVSQGGTWMTRIAQTLLVLDMTDGSGTAVGVLAAFQYGPVLLFGAFAGALADRSDKWKMLVRAQTLAMFQSLALAAVVLTGNATFTTVAVLAAAQGFINAFDNPVRRTFVGDAVPPELMNNANSLNTAAMTSARVFGPALGGLVVITLGYGACFLLDGLSYLAVLYGFFRMRRSEFHHQPAPTGARGGEVRAGLRYIRATPELRVTLVVMAVIGALAFNMPVTVPLLVRGLGGSKLSFTMLYSVLSVGSVFGALWVARQTRIVPRMAITTAVWFGVVMTMMALAPGMTTLFPIAVAVGFASIAFVSTSTSIVQTEAAPEFRGRVMAIQTLAFMGTTPIGGPLLGLISDLTDPRVSVGVGAAACFLTAAYAARRLPHRPDAPSPAATTTALRGAVSLGETRGFESPPTTDRGLRAT